MGLRGSWWLADGFFLAAADKVLFLSPVTPELLQLPTPSRLSPEQACFIVA
jgi:hypothetical protein